MVSRNIILSYVYHLTHTNAEHSNQAFFGGGYQGFKFCVCILVSVNENQAVAKTVFICYQEVASSVKYSKCFWENHVKTHTKKAQLVCSLCQHKRLQINNSLISCVIFTFLMISFDYDKLLNAVIFFCCFLRYILSTVDLRVYTWDKHFVRSQFILIAPLCQCLLMIFYRTPHSVFHHSLFVSDGTHAGTTQTLIKPLFMSENSWLRNPFRNWAHF